MTCEPKERAPLSIRTGYFAKAKDYADAGYALVSIALKPAWFLPKELHLFQVAELCPTAEILALKDAPEVYTKRFQDEVLSRLDAETIISKLCQIADSAKTNKIVLLCWEAPDKFCHRHLVARWLSEHLGESVCELVLAKP